MVSYEQKHYITDRRWSICCFELINILYAYELAEKAWVWFVAGQNMVETAKFWNSQLIA